MPTCAAHWNTVLVFFQDCGVRSHRDMYGLVFSSFALTYAGFFQVVFQRSGDLQEYVHTHILGSDCHSTFSRLVYYDFFFPVFIFILYYCCCYLKRCAVVCSWQLRTSELSSLGISVPSYKADDLLKRNQEPIECVFVCFYRCRLVLAVVQNCKQLFSPGDDEV